MNRSISWLLQAFLFPCLAQVCSSVKPTSPGSLSQIDYTITSTKLSTTFPAWTSGDPSNCPTITYDLQQSDGSSISGLSFLTWDAATRTLDVETSDYSLNGQYGLTLVATVSGGLSNDESFNVQLKCDTSSWTMPSGLAQVDYTVGSGSTGVSFTAASGIDAACISYELLTDTNTGSIATHSFLTSWDSSSIEVTIDTSSSSDAGTYRLKLRGTVNTNEQKESNEFDLVIHCDISSWAMATQSDITYTVNSGSQVETLTAATGIDAVCITYELVRDDGSSISSLSFLTNFDASTRQLTISSTSNNDAGSYQLKVKGTAEGTVKESTVFQVTISRDCVGESITLPSISTQAYTVKASTLTVDMTPTVSDWTCIYNLRIEIVSSSIPSWMTFNSDTTNNVYSFEAQTNDNSQSGTYSLYLRAWSYITEATVEEAFDLVVTKDCSAFTLTLDAISDKAYNVYETFDEVFTRTQSEVGCVLSYELIQSDGSAIPTWMTFNTGTRAYQIFTEDNSLDGGVYDLRFRATVHPAVVQYQDFRVTVTKDCQYATLTFASSLADQTYEVNDPQKTFDFVAAAGNDTTNCPFTYSVTRDNVAVPSSNTEFFWWPSSSALTCYVETSNQNEVAQYTIKVTADNGHKQPEQTFQLTIQRDCSIATLVNSGSTSGYTYTIYEDEYSHSLPSFTTEYFDCPLTIVPTHNSVTMDSSVFTLQEASSTSGDAKTYALTLKIQSNDNNKGGTYAFIVTATNPESVSGSYSFTITIQKNCEYVQLVAGDWTTPYLAYKITEATVVMSKPVPSYNDSGCTYHQSFGYGELLGSETTITSPESFISALDFTNSMFYTSSMASPSNSHSISIFASESLSNSIVGLGQTAQRFKEYKMTVTVWIEPSELPNGGTVSRSTTLYVDVYNLCERVTTTNPTSTLQYEYIVRDKIKTGTVDHFATSWTHGTVGSISSISDLSTYCGSFNVKTDFDLTDSNFTGTVDNDFITYDLSVSPYQFQLYTENASKGGDSTPMTQFVYKPTVIGGFGDNYAAQSVVTLEINIRDDCWNSQLMKTQVWDTSLELFRREEKFYAINKFNDEVSCSRTDASQNERLSTSGHATGFQGCPGYCGPVQFSFLATIDTKTYTVTTSGVPIGYIEEPSLYNLTFNAQNAQQVGLYDLQITAQLTAWTGYPSVIHHFYVMINPCRATNIQRPTISNFTYNLQAELGTNVVEWEEFSHYPKCAYLYEYDSYHVGSDNTSDFNRSWPNDEKLKVTFIPDLSTPFSLRYEIQASDYKLLSKTEQFYFVWKIWDTETLQYIWWDHMYWELKFISFLVNAKPEFGEEIGILTAKVFEKTIFTMAPPSSDVVRTDLKVSNPRFWKFANLYVSPSNQQVTLTIEPNLNSQASVYFFQMFIYDDDPPEPQYTMQRFSIDVQEGLVLGEKADELPTYPPGWPTTQIESINDQGLILLSFSHLMNQANFEQLKDLETQELVSVLGFQVVPGVEQDSAMLAYSSLQVAKLQNSVSNSDETSFLELKIGFKKPTYISKGATADSIKLKLNETFFKTQSGYVLDYRNSVLKRNIPRQLPVGYNPADLAARAAGGNTAVWIWISVQFGLRMVLAKSLGPLWAMMNNLQITHHMVGINLPQSIPQNAATFTEAILPAIQFEIFPDAIAAAFFFWDYNIMMEKLREMSSVAGEDEEVSQIVAIGYESVNMVENMGTMYVFVVMYCFACLVYLLVVFIERKCGGPTTKKVREYIGSVLFWNFLFVMISEGFIEVTICCLRNITKRAAMGWQELTLHEQMSYILSYLFLITIILIPAIATYWLFKNYGQVIKEESIEKKVLFGYNEQKKRNVTKLTPLKQTFGSIWDRINTKSRTKMARFSLFFARRVLFCFTLMFLQDNPAQQIQILLLLALFEIIYIGLVSPYWRALDNKVELFNELVNCIVIYHFICYTDFLPDPEIQFQLGWSMIITLCLQALIGIVIILVDQIEAIRFRWEVKNLQKERKQRYDMLQTEINQQIQKGRDELYDPASFTKPISGFFDAQKLKFLHTQRDKAQMVQFHTKEFNGINRIAIMASSSDAKRANKYSLKQSFSKLKTKKPERAKLWVSEDKKPKPNQLNTLMTLNEPNTLAGTGDFSDLKQTRNNSKVQLAQRMSLNPIIEVDQVEEFPDEEEEKRPQKQMKHRLNLVQRKKDFQQRLNSIVKQIKEEEDRPYQD